MNDQKSRQPRSPQYPLLDIQAALSKLALAHDTYGTRPVHRADLVRTMGYSGESGSALRAVSSLTQYGFLKKAGKGQVAVTERGVSALHGEQHERMQAMEDALRQPAIFSEILENHERPPGKPVLQSFLRRKEYGPAAAEKAASTFLKSYEHVQSTAATDRNESGVATTQNDPTSALPEPGENVIEGEFDVISKTAPANSRLVLKGSAGPELDFQIFATDRLTEQAIDCIGEYLELLKKSIRRQGRLPPPDDDDDSVD